MVNDLRERLADAAGRPEHTVDLGAVEHRARHLARRRGAVRAISVVLVGAVVLGGALLATRNGSDHAPTRIAAPIPSTTASAEVFDSQGDRVQLPSGWYRTATPLVPYLSWPKEILSAATFPITPDDQGAGCDAQLPKGTLDAMQPTDAFVWIVESTSQVSQALGRRPDPSQFPQRPAHFSLDQFDTYDCEHRYPHATFRQLYFTDNGRVIGAYVTLGDQATPERTAQVLSLLDNLQINTEATPQASDGPGWSGPLSPSCVVTAASQEGCALSPAAAEAALGFAVRSAAGIPTGWVTQRQNLRLFTDATPKELRPPGLDAASEYDEIFADPSVDLKMPVSACAPVILINQTGYDPFAQTAPPGDQVDLGDGHTARGMLGTTRCAPEPDAPTADTTFLTWHDRGVWITLSANGISRDSALAIARSLIR